MVGQQLDKTNTKEIPNTMIITKNMERIAEKNANF